MPATPDAPGKNGGGTTITIAICTYQRYELLRLAVESCLRQTIRAEGYQILVVDNSPDRARSEEEKARYAGMARVDYVIEAAPGLSHARNVAVRRCGTPYIAYLDDDAQA